MWCPPIVSPHILRDDVPSATHFRLFVRGIGAGSSPGTAKSAVENMDRQGMIRRNGKLVQVPLAWNVREQDFGRGYTKVVSIGWGDVSTAYYSTGIPNIETYFSFPDSYINFMRFLRLVGPLMYNRPVKGLLKLLIDLFLPEPKEELRKKASAILIGEASAQNGGRAITKLTVPEGYTCTALTTVEIMKRILANDLKTGFQTPSLAYGPDFILGFDKVKRENLS